MWQNYAKGKAAALARKKAELAKKQKLDFHLKRVTGEIRLSRSEELDSDAPPVVLPARLMINDFTPSGLSLFVTEPIMVGQEIALTLENPRQFFVKGRIVSCQELLNRGPIISEEVYCYRIELQFILESDEEKKAVQEYTADLLREYCGIEPRAA